MADVKALMAEKLGMKGRSLPQAVRKYNHRLPRGLRRDAVRLAEASHLAGHPKLALTLDNAALEAAADRLLTHLKAIDLKDRRKGAILGLLGALSFNLIVVFVLLLVVLIWRGFL